MIVHLVDGTYELFRHFFALPSHRRADGVEVAATRGVLGSVLTLLEDGATHVGVATDHVIESYRNELWPGYKTGAGVDPALRSQFGLLEESLAALGVAVWPMVEYEADDALAAAAHVAAADPRVEQVRICTPDKDLAQCVVDQRVVQVDRRANKVFDRAAVIAKFGVPPESIPDFLGLVGDSADGFPGLPGWGAKTAAAVLSVYGRVERIPHAPGQWEAPVRNAPKLARTLADEFERALLFRELATLQREGPEVGSPDEWEWTGPTDELAAVAASLDAPGLLARARRCTARRPG
ncbi:MAG: 5'-3' exonuclease H3TH domain-containing protein [Acidimicrobiales bacterium]